MDTRTGLARMVLVGMATGVLSASAGATVIRYLADMDGPSEFPPVASPGTGVAVLDYDSATTMIRVRAVWQDLLGNTTVAHTHAPTAQPFAGTVGVASQTPTYPGFPAGVTAGSYDATFDLSLTSSYNPAFVTANGGTAAGARAAFLQALADGKAYFNVHTNLHPGGEIRGFFIPVTMCLPDITAGAIPGTTGYGVPNGVLNNDDFFYYLALFSAGC